MIIDVTEFQLPNGRQVHRKLEVDDECEGKYKELVGCGCRLTAEALRTGEVSQCIEGSDFDFDIILTSGDDLEENKKKLEEMIMRFDKKSYLEMEKQYQ